MNKAGRAPSIDESDWVRLVQIERRLEGEIAAAEADAASRVAAARAQAAAATGDPAALAARAAQEEQDHTARHRDELARLVADADALSQRLAAVPDERIDALARWVVEAALAQTDPTPPP